MSPAALHGWIKDAAPKDMATWMRQANAGPQGESTENMRADNAVRDADDEAQRANRTADIESTGTADGKVHNPEQQGEATPPDGPQGEPVAPTLPPPPAGMPDGMGFVKELQDPLMLQAFRRYVGGLANGAHPLQAMHVAQMVHPDFDLNGTEQDLITQSVNKLTFTEASYRGFMLELAQPPAYLAKLIEDSQIDGATLQELEDTLTAVQMESYLAGINAQLMALGMDPISSLTDPAVLQAIQDDAAQRAAGIADTWNNDAATQAGQAWLTSQDITLPPGDYTDNDLGWAGATGDARQQALEDAMQGWVDDRSDYKSDMWASDAAQTGFNQAVLDFQDQNGLASTGYIDGPNPAVCQECQDWLDKGDEIPIDELQEFPPDGLHPQCTHSPQPNLTDAAITSDTPLWTAQAETPDEIAMSEAIMRTDRMIRAAERARDLTGKFHFKSAFPAASSMGPEKLKAHMDKEHPGTRELAGKVSKLLAVPPDLAASHDHLHTIPQRHAHIDTLGKWRGGRAVRAAEVAAMHLADANPSNLIDWYNNGADGAIDWGGAGAYDSCVSIASNHMDDGDAHGFCYERALDATGVAPGRGVEASESVELGDHWQSFDADRSAAERPVSSNEIAAHLKTGGVMFASYGAKPSGVTVKSPRGSSHAVVSYVHPNIGRFGRAPTTMGAQQEQLRMQQAHDLLTSKGYSIEKQNNGDLHVTRGTAKLAEVSTVIAAGLAVLAVDSGRVLLIQRSNDDTDPAAGLWEFPGGHVETGEGPLEAAMREWSEEVGQQLPPGSMTGTWSAPNGRWRGFVWQVASESTVPIHEEHSVLNPDDPDGDAVETAAWFDPSHIVGNPAMRPEMSGTDLSQLKVAAPDDENDDARGMTGIVGASERVEAGDRWATFDADRAANPRVYWARYDAGNPDRWKQYAAMAAAHPAEFAKLAEFQKARDTAAAKIAANPAPSEQDKQRNRDAAEKAAPAQADIRGKSSDRDARAAHLLKEFGDGKTCPCVYCGRTLTKDTLSQDKLYTFNEGGRYKLANLVPCDLGCNKSRGDSKLTSRVFAADMTLPTPGTVVTAVPLGLHEAMREKSQPLPDPEIPTMAGAPATVKGPLFAMHISDPAAGIEYVKCVVGGWDVDPATIDAHGADLSEPWDAFAESRSIALGTHEETTHWQDVDDNRAAVAHAQAAREAKMPGNLNRTVPKGTLLYTTTNGPGKVSPSDRGHSGPGLYVSEDPTRQAAAGQGERQHVLQTTRSLRLLNRDNPTGETRYKEMGPYDYSANQEPDAFRAGMKKGGWDGITYTPPGSSKPDVTLLDPQHTTTEIQRPRI